MLGLSDEDILSCDKVHSEHIEFIRNIEGIRNYILQQDAADGITALCDGLFSQSLRTLRKLEPLKRNVVVS